MNVTAGALISCGLLVSNFIFYVYIEISIKLIIVTINKVFSTFKMYFYSYHFESTIQVAAYFHKLYIQIYEICE